MVRCGHGADGRNGLVGRIGLHLPDLFRFQWIFRYGHRSGKDVRIPFRRKLQLSVRFPLHYGVLAALAYLPVQLVPGLCLHSVGRKPGENGSKAYLQSLRGMAPDGNLARSELDFHPVGSDVLRPSGDGEEAGTPQGGKISLDESTEIHRNHVLCHHGMGAFPSRQPGRCLALYELHVRCRWMGTFRTGNLLSNPVPILLAGGDCRISAVGSVAGKAIEARVRFR